MAPVPPPGQDDRQATAPPALRARLFLFLEAGGHAGAWGRALEWGLILLILANIIAFAAETVPHIESRYGPALRLFDGISVIIFTVEYLVRLWVSPEHPLYRGMPPWRARLRFARTPLMIIDLLAIVPFYLSQLLGMDLRVLRIFRLLRFLKLARYSPALAGIAGVIASEWRALVGAVVVMAGIMIISASLIYLVEGPVQPDVFGTVPLAMWWAVTTLTTVGYGDVVPVTALGKVIGAIVMMTGLATFALPVGIIATGFSQEVHRREFTVNWAHAARIPLFAELGPGELSHILELVRTRVAAPGTVLSYRGERTGGLYIIASGLIDIRGNDEPVLLGTGDWFGEADLIEDEYRASDIIARTRTHLIHIDADDFRALLARSPALEDRIRDASKAGR